jgi:integrase
MDALTRITPVVGAIGSAAKGFSASADAYLAAYKGRDGSRYRRIEAWQRQLGDLPVDAITSTDVRRALAAIASEPAKVFYGKDADGNRIFKPKAGGSKTPSTINRYRDALAAFFKWARNTGMLPEDHVPPTKFVVKGKEPRGRVRFLDDEERTALLAACRESSWPRLWLLVMMALTTGARRGELLGLRWCDIDVPP